MGNIDYECPHRVSVPPSKPFFKSLKSGLKETLFPDDPFRQFKNLPASRKFLLGLQYFVPILEWAPRYTFEFFKADLIAGITIASLAVPQGISYANLANLPPIIGLCKYRNVISFLLLNNYTVFLSFDGNNISNYAAFFVEKGRFQLCSTIDIRHDGQLKRFGSGHGSCCFTFDIFHVRERR